MSDCIIKVNSGVDIGTLLDSTAKAGRGWEFLVGGMDNNEEGVREEQEMGEVDEEHKHDTKNGRIDAEEYKDRDEGRHAEEMEGWQNDSTDTPDESMKIDDAEEEKSDCKIGEKTDATQDGSRKEDGIDEGSEKVNEVDKAEDGDDETEVCRWWRWHQST